MLYRRESLQHVDAVVHCCFCRHFCKIEVEVNQSFCALSLYLGDGILASEESSLNLYDFFR